MTTAEAGAREVGLPAPIVELPKSQSQEQTSSRKITGDPVDAIIVGIENIANDRNEHDKGTTRIEKTAYGKIKDGTTWANAGLELIYVLSVCKLSVVRGAVGNIRAEGQLDVLEFDTSAECTGVHRVHHQHAPLRCPQAYGAPNCRLRADLQLVLLCRLLPQRVRFRQFSRRLNLCLWISVQVYIFGLDRDSKSSIYILKQKTAVTNRK